VLRHQDAVFALAYRVLGNNADAEEIAQETFVRLYEAAPRYRPDAAFRTYLLRITTNLCLNRKARAYRQREQQREPQEIDAAPANSPAPADPEHLVLREERAAAVRAAVLALPEDQRVALILFRYEGFSYEAIAELTNKSVSAVTSLLWRARAALRASLGDWVAEPGAQDPPQSPVRT
jgi:RNA polymerase sigma-70 factor (ECF subfamily)